MTANDSDTLKWCLMGSLFIVAFIMGLLPIWLLPVIKKFAEKAALILSSISCFSGGILLGVCFVDMIPEAMADFDDWQTLSGQKVDFPWILCGTVIGFLIVYIIDGLSTYFLRRQEQAADRAKADLASISMERLHRATICSMDAEAALKIQKVVKSEKQEYVTTLTLILALCIHVLIEGFALGVQPTSESFLTLFIGIAIHKVLVVFAIGMKLYEKHADNKKFVAIAMSTLAVLTFLGGAAGILLQDADLDEVTKALTTAILSCFSAGTFLYITFFEILADETGHILERLLCIVGFAAMTTALNGSSTERLHRATICSMDAEAALKIQKVVKSEKQEYVTTLTLILALCIHVLIEGFALGVQPTSESFLTLFIGIAIHKVLVVFAIGMKLYEKHADNKKFVAIAMSTLAVLTFLGGAAGILLQDADLDEVTKALTTAILSCFSAGTFLYITFFEILADETGHILERLLCIVGFAAMTTALYFF